MLKPKTVILQSTLPLALGLGGELDFVLPKLRGSSFEIRYTNEVGWIDTLIGCRYHNEYDSTSILCIGFIYLSTQ